MRTTSSLSADRVPTCSTGTFDHSYTLVGRLPHYLLTSGLIVSWLVKAERLTVTRVLAVSGERWRLKAGCLLPRLARRSIAEELDDHENRKDEHIVKERVVPAMEDRTDAGRLLLVP
jgi:hypothetical protein